MPTAFANRNYGGAAVDTTLSGGINNSVTALTVVSATGWPSVPFFAVIDRGTVNEEKVYVTTAAGTSFSVLERGVDGTPAVSHSNGATVHHCVAAQDISEANDMSSVMTTKGDLITRTSSAGPARQGIGTDGQVLIADSSQTNGLKWGEAASAGLATNAVGSAEIQAGAVTSTKLGSLSVATSAIQADAVTTAKIADANVTGAKLAAALPQGQLGRAIVTADQLNMSGTTDLTSLSVTVTVGSNRLIEIRGHAFLTADGAQDITGVIKESTTELGRFGRFDAGGAAESTLFDGGVLVVAPSSGSHTYKLTVISSASTVDLEASSTNQAWIRVLDLGASS